MWWILLAILFIIAVVAYLLWEIVVKPSITAGTDKAEYDVGETVIVSGVLSTAGDDSGKTVQAIVSPPSGDDYILPSGTTTIGGAYSISWSIPSDAVEGIYTVSVQSGSATASATFTRNSMLL